MHNVKFKIFVVFHNDINPDYYEESLVKDLIFVNVNPNNPNINRLRTLGYQVINQYEFKNFISLGKQFAESEVIYNIFKNPYLTADADYVGFMQYDMNTHHLSKQELEALTETYSHIAFDEHRLYDDYATGYMMDERYPDKWIGTGKNCYVGILEDYNRFYGSKFRINELRSKGINLCCTFLLEKSYYNKMMGFISSIIESKKLDLYDSKRVHRTQGGLLERYFGLWLTINTGSYFHRPIEHVFDTTVTKRRASFYDRIINLVNRKMINPILIRLS